MKTQSNLSIILSLVVAIFTLVGCSDYDNGVTETRIQFDRNFKEQFPNIDPEQDWNLVERSGVTVITSSLKDIKIYAEQNGDFNILGNYKKVIGTQKLSFDMYEGTQLVIVSDGETAMRAYVGGTVNFDEHTSVAGENMETRSHHVNRNEWEDNGFIVPNNITDDERDAVIAAFSIPHYGAVNEVTIPWEAIWVQQVYRSGVEYTASDGGKVIGSDQMNHLQLYNQNVAVNETMGGRYEHVNDFNTASHHSSWQDIIGLTLMYNIDPTNVVTEDITNVYGQPKTWVKQWAYHNTEDSRYHYDYIYKMVGGNLYIGFDFYAHNTEIQPGNYNMDVERDWVFNDWILKVAPAVGKDVPQESIPEANPVAWVLACEDLGSTDDVDYNDVVVKVEHVAGEEKAYVTPLAAGGTLASYLYFISSENPSLPQCVGEIHQLFDEGFKTESGSYQTINVGGLTAEAPKRYPVNVGKTWSMACYSTADWDAGEQHAATNMGGFSIKVLPAGSAAADMKIGYNDAAFKGSHASEVQSPNPGETPYIVCLPYSYVDPSTSTTNPWMWPLETDNITYAYYMFSGWVQNHNSNKNWFTAPDSKYVVSKSLVQSISRIINQSIHQAATSETVAAATQVAYGQIIGVTEWEENEIPEPMLRLKDGVSAIYLSVGETANLYDYVETNFPIYCVIEGGTGIVDYANADHSKIYSVGSEGNTTTVTIKQYTIDGATLDVTAGTMRETNFKLQSGGNDVSGGTIELQANEQKTIEGWWENCPDDKAILDVSITNNGSGTTFTKSGKNIIVTAGSTYGTTETLTVEFSAVGPYFPATKTVNIKVVETPKQGSDLYAYASSSSVEQGGTVTINASGSGGDITYSCPSNVGTMSGNVFTAASNFTGTATITVRQAGTTEREAGEVTVDVNVTKKTDGVLHDYGTLLTTQSVVLSDNNNYHDNVVETSSLPTSGQITFIILTTYEWNNLGSTTGVVKGLELRGDVWYKAWAEDDLGTAVPTFVESTPNYNYYSLTVDASKVHEYPYIKFKVDNGSFNGAYYQTSALAKKRSVSKK